MRVFWAIFFVLGILSGCGGQVFDPPQPGEIAKGPGLFTGEAGAWVLTPEGLQRPGKPSP